MRWPRMFDARQQWRSWFAWKPIHLHGQWIWLEFVHRRYVLSGGFWEYAAHPPMEHDR